MPAEESHRLGVRFFEAANFPHALEQFCKALSQSESAELWSDWAAAQFALRNLDEAEAGFLLALEVDPAHTDALVNLGVVLLNQGRFADAEPILRRALDTIPAAQKPAIEELLAQATVAQPPDHRGEWENYLRSFLRDDENERSYFETHLKRYLETLALLPEGSASSKLLELGAAFHHITPALQSFKRYGSVRCNDIWSGAAQQVRRIASAKGESFEFLVDNFDVQFSPWPYEDASFDAVLCCEMLEHLHTDPMGLIAEINRILKPGGFLLLTTPNLSSSHGLEFAMKGESPYVYGKFERSGTPTDRHNREYTSSEVERLAVAGGFRIVTLKTKDSWWPRNREVLRLLATEGHPIARRGDNTFLLARKEASLGERYPEEFYQSHGTQSSRRVVQGEVQNNTRQESEEPGSQNILVIHELLPHFDRSGSDLRLLDVLRELRAQDHAVTFIARDGHDFERYKKSLEDLGISVFCNDANRLRHTGNDGETEWSLEEILQRGKFHLAILCQWFWSGISIPEHYLEEIRLISPSTRIAVLTDDRHGERERRMSALNGHLSDVERSNDFESREVEAYRRADLVLYIAEADHKHFTKLIPDLPAEHLPMVAALPEPGPARESREGVLFLGNFENLANRDALGWLQKTIWPLVYRQRPDLKLYVAGHGTPENVADAQLGIVRLGHLPRLGEAFAGRLVFAAPIRFGTGINTKNLQALSHGLPVVTTSVGAEGLGLKNQVHALVADDPSSFAKSILRLTTDASLWERLAISGRDFVSSHFSLETLRSQVRRIVARAAALPPKRANPEQWSYRKVEDALSEVLTERPARYRLILRTLGYWQVGARLLESGDAAAALEQFRHVFTVLRGPMPATVFHRRLLADMQTAYSALHDSASAARCKQELGELVSLESQSVRAATSSLVPAREKSAPPKLSVVLPTFNRKDVLRLCLSVLAFQTLPESLWEVIVVDDGSSDGTVSFCHELVLPFRLNYLRQANQGAGAARRAGVEAACGEFVLLCNDDTIASSTLLSEHLRVHSAHPREKWAVLGDFRPSELCAERALSLWVNISPFFFVQQSLKAGQLYDASHFVTCNLSIRRDAILAAGNFDPSFRVAEDTELGARLEKCGFRVHFHPSAHATHEHAQFTSANLLRRANLYGAADWHLFQKHPQLLASGQSPFGRLEVADFLRIEAEVRNKSFAVADAVAALEALDKINFLPLFVREEGKSSAAQEVLEKVAQIVPLVYWHTLFKSFLAERDRSAATPQEISLAAAQDRA